MLEKKVDKPFLITIVILVLVGFFVFFSASMGLLTRSGARLSSVIFNQFFLGIVGGTIALLITSKIPYKNYKKYSFFIFLFSLFLTMFVFIPNIGLEFGGAQRWVKIGSITFQPAELLKLGFVIYFATWLSNIKEKVKTFRFGVLPLIAILLITGVVLLNQPDYGTFLVICMAAIGMFFVSGAKWSHLFLLGLTLVIGLLLLVRFEPYAWQRILTFMDPSSDSLGSGYQIQQSLIAIGSGEFFGRGFGKSIQKFQYLPEPIGDSVFAVTAEEWGFLGASSLILIFLFFALRGFAIASKSEDKFGGLLVLGIVIIIVSQSFINIASMLAIFPLTGMPLLFVSHGGTAMFILLLEVGIILNVSKYKKLTS